MLDLTLPEFFVICGSLLLATFLLTEIFEWTNIFGPLETPLPIAAFGTPNVWKFLYPESRIEGKESPINITTCSAVVVQPSEPLKWAGFASEPIAMTIANDGNTVTVSGFWCGDFRPSIEGGPLTEIYDFHSMIFHWGPTDRAGSEHSIDGVNYPLELQMIHVKRDFHSPLEAIVTGEKHGVVIVSILFQISNEDNKNLDHVIRNLVRIPRPGTKICIPSFALDEMFPLFEKNYYSYTGSMMRETANELVTWIVQSKPFGVSSFQMAKFRNVYLADAPILVDAKPIQRQNERELYYHD